MAVEWVTVAKPEYGRDRQHLRSRIPIATTEGTSRCPLISTTTFNSKRSIAFRQTLSWVWTVFGPFLGLVLITGLFAVLTRESGQFLTADNWRTIAVQTVIVATAALGMTIIMIAGGIDLSVGSTVALVTVCMARLHQEGGPELAGVDPGMEAGHCRSR